MTNFNCKTSIFRNYIKWFVFGLLIILFISCKYNLSPYADMTLKTLLAPYDVRQFTPVDVVILSGQSNMASNGITGEAEQYLSAEEYNQINNGIDSITIFSRNDCIPINGGYLPFSKISFDYNIYKNCFGPEIGFALECKKADRGLVIIKYTISGMDINCFLADNDVSQIMKTYIMNCLSILVCQGYYPNIQAFCWMQGEADCSNNASAYYAKEKRLIKYIRQAFNEKLIFIDARITDWKLVDPDCQQDIVNEAKEKIAQEDERCFLIDSTGLTKKYFDRAHYDTPSTIELGRRFARMFLNNTAAGK